jgi:hypothetical protein
MSDEHYDEHFLARWSRRKQAAAANAPAKAEDAAATSAEPAETRPATTVAPVTPSVQAASIPPQPAFDPASLPPLDSITATTDVRNFLASGVPATLTREALRRAWVADPAIRDFVGLQDYDWDFTKPGSMAGFGELGQEHDVAEMVARVFGELPASPVPTDTEAGAPPPAQPIVQSTESASSAEPPAPQASAAPDPVGDLAHPHGGTDDASRAEVAAQQSNAVVQHDKDFASHHDDFPGDRDRKSRRSHGRALPKS